jgi:hypothetical protein
MSDDFVFVPPRKVYADDLIVDDPLPGGLGKNVEFWRVLLWYSTLARKARQAASRADAAPHHPVRDEDQPPPLAADDAEPDPAEGLRENFQLHTILAKIERFEQRIEALEKRKKANDLLLALEAAELPEDGEDRTLN